MKYLLSVSLFTFLAGLGVVFAYFPAKALARVGRADLPPTPVFLASKNGAVFGFPWCGIIPRIKTENIVILSHKIDALERGFRPMKGCRGLSENP
ncbi:MAG: hypothetical protein KBD47_01985 [Candidatus Pacebacteria bacterium]|nr:hypothetical protein [Candidatus Paceibacterota bacterium]